MMKWGLTPPSKIEYITEDHYICDVNGHKATTSSGATIKVPKDYLDYYTMIKKGGD
jgi:hypothetical protein